jgi:predicted transglutaminase-like cysteine proteinase
MTSIRQTMASTALCAALIAAAFAAAGEVGFSRSVTPGLIEHLARLFGQGARGRLDGWKEFVRSNAVREGAGRGGSGEIELLRPVNGFFNRLPSITDLAHWGVEDYWATPSEFLASNAGDCEDYAIAKYFTLKELGVPVSRLRLVYAQTWRANAAHMVLAYYASPGAEPLILDDLEGSIRPASDRPDLTPVYTFNDDDLLFLQQRGSGMKFDSQSIRKWREVLEKLARELTY